jgi:peptide chain release factor 1
VESLLSDPATVSDPRYPGYVREHGRLKRVVDTYDRLKAVLKEGLDAEVVMETESDEEMVELAREEVETLQAEAARLHDALLDGVLSGEENESRNVIMEIRAGTGGDEACLFAADLFRMYTKYAESKGWKTEVMSGHQTDLGGYKEIITGISGEGAFGRLRFESGTHRVQRVPDTEASGRIHTSAATVAVLPEAEAIDLEIKPEDIRVDTYRSSGPGGQHANKTSSAVRITHEPTGTVVSCEDEKSQHKNKAKAMRILRSRLYNDLQSKQDEERGQTRRNQIGSGDRSEKIRTYNFPQNRVSDHRINLTLYDLDGIMEGNLDKIVDALRDRHRQARVAALANE